MKVASQSIPYLFRFIVRTKGEMRHTHVQLGFKNQASSQ
jgi:hypothetical protein